jgi:hypothetical protein
MIVENNIIVKIYGSDEEIDINPILDSRLVLYTGNKPCVVGWFWNLGNVNEIPYNEE